MRPQYEYNNHFDIQMVLYKDGHISLQYNLQDPDNLYYTKGFGITSGNTASGGTAIVSKAIDLTASIGQSFDEDAIYEYFNSSNSLDLNRQRFDFMPRSGGGYTIMQS